MSSLKFPAILAISGLAMVSLVGCTHRLTDFTVISTKNIPIGEGVHTDFQKGTKRVKGVDVAHEVLCVPLGFPNMKEAIDRAVEQIPGAIGLVDGVVKSSGWTCLLYGQSKYIVEGTPLFPTSFDYEENAMGRPDSYNRKANTRTSTVNHPVVPIQDTTSTYIFFHEVKDGETIATIAQQYGVGVGEIIKWNQLSQNVLSKGQKLKIHIKE